MSPAQGNSYGSIAIDDSPQENVGVPHERARSLLSLSMLCGTAALLLTMFVAYNGKFQDSYLTTSQLLESHGDSIDEEHPDTTHWYKHQLVDHFDDSNKKTWNHRYYQSKKHFGGPGSPIFLVVGGEGPMTKLLYPFIHDHLAKTFSAYVLQPEHRFYGESNPVKIKHDDDYVGLLTSEQAMADMLRLLKYKQEKLGCSTNRSSKHYCPVISVGGSYPGFLSAMVSSVMNV
jgi:hypothetical protein